MIAIFISVVPFEAFIRLLPASAVCLFSKYEIGRKLFDWSVTTDGQHRVANTCVVDRKLRAARQPSLPCCYDDGP
jgi:hypothetical protein